MYCVLYIDDDGQIRMIKAKNDFNGDNFHYDDEVGCDDDYKELL